MSIDNDGKQVASIRLDREDRARGTIWLIEENPGISVEVRTPDGIEHPSLPLFHTEWEARCAIQDSWGVGPWDLQWDGAT